MNVNKKHIKTPSHNWWAMILNSECKRELESNKKAIILNVKGNHSECKRELEREEKKLELEIKKAAKMGNKQVITK